MIWRTGWIVPALALLLGPVAAAEAQAPLSLHGRSVELSLEWTGVDALRVRVAPIDESGSVNYPPDGPMLVEQTRHGDPLRLRTTGSPQTLTHDGLTARVDPDSWTIAVEDRAGRVIQSVRLDPASGTVRIPMAEGVLLGLGQAGRQFDRRGDGNAFGNAGGSSHWDTGMRLAVPWLMNTAGGAIYFNTVALPEQSSLVLEGEEAVFEPAGPEDAPLLALDIFLVASDDPATMLRALGSLLGTASLPPRWALGYQQSFRTLGVAEDPRNPAPARNDFPQSPLTPHEILEVVREFRARDLPIDQVIYLGTGYTPAGWNTGHGSFEWNPDIFDHPDGPMEPEAFVAALHDMDVRVSLHMNAAPGGLHGLVSESAEGSPEPELHASQYWERHRALTDRGVDTFWPDEGEFRSYIPRVARVRMYFEGPHLEDPEQRTYGLYRGGGFPGMQRYGGWVWSGDVYSTWELLSRQVEVGINTSLSGLPFWGTDTGGFWTMPEFDGELYVRWFQFSAFNPLFRSHGRTWPIKMPHGWDREPGEFIVGEVRVEDGMGLPPDDVLPDPRVEPIARDYLNLRYRLLPHTYSLVWEAHRTGLPIMRAMWVHYPDDPATHGMGDQYLWGRDILVAPVVEPGAKERELYLPEGGWYDFWSGRRVEGGRWIVREVDLATLPLYVREGAILPTGPVQQFVDEIPFPPLTVTVHPGADGRFLLVEDDGTGLSPGPNERMELELVWDDAAGTLSISLANGTRMLGPPEREVTVVAAGSDVRRTVTFTGEPLLVAVTPAPTPEAADASHPCDGDGCP